jgi:hypothetical protein
VGGDAEQLKQERVREPALEHADVEVVPVAAREVGEEPFRNAVERVVAVELVDERAPRAELAVESREALVEGAGCEPREAGDERELSLVEAQVPPAPRTPAGAARCDASGT